MVATMASAAENTDTAQANVLPTITIETQGNWLENANEKKVQKHAGARTIIDRKRLNESAATSLKDALRQVPGVQVQENNGTGGSDVFIKYWRSWINFSPLSTFNCVDRWHTNVICTVWPTTAFDGACLFRKYRIC